MDNATKQQHFISQMEQRLNASNPAANPENQRIYEFKVVDREQHVLELTDVRGKSIAKTLSMFDLFSFDVDKKSDTRANFEAVFYRYESRLLASTDRLLQAHSARSASVSQEVFDIFVSKMVNFVRNPYSVVKMLNTFGALANIHPTNPALYASYERVLRGRKPQQAYLCRQLGISDEQYESWLRVMLMLLVPLAEGTSTLFEQSLQSLFTRTDQAVAIYVHRYLTERCLLSDRGFSSPIPEDTHLVFDFNLRFDAFIRIAFMDVQAVRGQPVPDWVQRAMIGRPKPVAIYYCTDDFAALDSFHRRVVEQCCERVFCSGATPYGLTVRL
jgi:hypothetical protein